MNKFNLPFTLLLCFILTSSTPGVSQSQQALEVAQQWEHLKQNQIVESYKVDALRSTPSIIKLSDNISDSKKMEDAPEIMKTLLRLRPAKDAMRVKKVSKYNENVELTRFQQHYQNIKVEHGQYLATAINNRLYSLNGEYYQIEEMNTTPSLEETQALESALNFVDADEYAWETIAKMNDNFVLALRYKKALNEYYEDYLPKGELVIVDDYSTPEVDLNLAYKFNIYASYPLSRAHIYVNAHTGEIMLRDAIIKHASGDTRYSGNRTFGSEIGTSGSFELLNTVKGGGIETRNLEGAGGLPISVGAVYELSEAFEDNDGTWTFAEHNEAVFTNEVHNDDIALDAHWGAEVVYDYWLARHGRKSYDDNDAKIFSFVHYGVNYDNAFWNGSYMTYGDGSYQRDIVPGAGDFAPLTSMDVCAHEIGHAICSHTSDLVYQRESGAMNEGFSDLWAAAVENYVLTDVDGTLPYDPWGIGEQVDERDGGLPPGDANSRALRWMDDPQAAGDPDTYGGTNWVEPECGEPTLANDQCGVHTNSGVLNKWFYLLVNGSGQPLSPGLSKAASDDGVNDIGDPYNFTGIGYIAAEKIAFLTETLLFPNAKFQDARYAAELAAGILYGPCSNEQDVTLQAWSAVNVTGDGPNCDPRVDFVNASSTENEQSGTNGCTASKIVGVNIYAIGVTSTVTISAVGTGVDPAVAGIDFNLLTTSVDFSTESVQTVEIEIFDDAYVENNEELTLSISGYPGNEHVMTISDNDVVPTIGLGIVDVLPIETFSVTGHPTGWSTVAVNPESANDWEFNGTGQAAGKAYATIPGTGLPAYNQTADANVILRTPYLDARGVTSLNASFTWTAGGEVDVADGTLFDYGSFGYSTNGTDFIWLDHYVGDAGGNVPVSGTYNLPLPGNLDDSEFYLGWRWYNDALVGSGFSFVIDDVQVTGNEVPIATTLNDSDAAQVNNDEAYFYSSNGEIIAKVKSLGGDFGCVDVNIQEAGTGQQIFEFGDRSDKVFQVTSTNTTDPYEVTFYFTAAELATFGTDATLLNMIKVDGTDINAADDLNSVIVENVDLTAMTINADNDISYTASFTGFSVFTVYLPTVILPVELLNFEARAEKAEILLDWNTASEKNNAGFEVLRRAEDENDFYNIGWVDGHGTTNIMMHYNFVDRDVKSGMTYYYRLNQIDHDGKESLSEIRVASLDKSGGLVKIFPNPTSGIVHINAIDNNFKSDRPIDVFSADRQLVKTVSNPEGVNQVSIDLNGLPSGLYFIRVYIDGEMIVKKVFKERK